MPVELTGGGGGEWDLGGTVPSIINNNNWSVP